MEEDDRASVFGMIFDGTAESEALNRRKGRNSGMENGVIRPPSSLRPKRISSRAYTRPIFKEPGSKITPAEGLDYSQESYAGASDDILDRSRSIVRELLGDVRSRENSYGPNEVIEPSNSANKRLQRILGRPTDRFPLDDINPSVGLQKSMLRKQHGDEGVNPRHQIQQDRQYGYHSGGRRSSRRLKSSASSYRRSTVTSEYDDRTECEESVATVSDLDNLAAKALRRKRLSYGKQPSNDLSILKEEIKEMVRRLDERDDLQASRVGKRGAVKNGRQHQDGLNKSKPDPSATSKIGSSRVPSKHSSRDSERDDDTGNCDGCTLRTIASTGFGQILCETPPLPNFIDDLKEYFSL